MIPGRAHPYRDRRAVAATHRDQGRAERRRDRQQKTVNTPREEPGMADDASPERYRAPETPAEELAAAGQAPRRAAAQA